VAGNDIAKSVTAVAKEIAFDIQTTTTKLSFYKSHDFGQMLSTSEGIPLADNHPQIPPEPVRVNLEIHNAGRL
jgi:hypothetical protein